IAVGTCDPRQQSAVRSPCQLAQPATTAESPLAQTLLRKRRYDAAAPVEHDGATREAAVARDERERPLDERRQDVRTVGAQADRFVHARLTERAYVAAACDLDELCTRVVLEQCGVVTVAQQVGERARDGWLRSGDAHDRAVRHRITRRLCTAIARDGQR